MKVQISNSFALFSNEVKQLEGVRVLLIYPPVRLNQEPLYPPFGLLSIASVLEKAGAKVEIIDLNILRLPFKLLQKEIAKRQFDIVATGGMTTVYYFMKFLALYLKREYPAVPLIAGGTACSGSPEVVMENTKFDVAVLGEGEPVIIEIIFKLLNNKDLSGVPGIIFRESGKISKTEGRPRMQNIEDLPLPAYHLIDMERYISNSDIYKNKKNKVAEARIKKLNLDRTKAGRPIMIFSKRGCPFGCNFCYRNFGRKVVGLSVKNVLNHLSFLEKNYNTINFVFGDEIFNVDKRWVMEFCNAIIDEKRNYILNVGNGLRANVLDREMMEKMMEAGFCSVAVGIESFYDPTLKDMQKGQTADEVATAIRIIKDTGFHLVSAQFLFGYPSDCKESMEVNVQMCKELDLKNAAFAIPCPYPGTYLFNKAIEEGLLVDVEGWLMELADRDISDRIINMSSLTDSELNQFISEGLDEIRMHFISKEHPLAGWFMTRLQKMGRKININVFDILKAFKDRIKVLVAEGRWAKSWRKSGGTNDVYIRDEVFDLLELWETETLIKNKVKNERIHNEDLAPVYKSDGLEGHPKLHWDASHRF